MKANCLMARRPGLSREEFRDYYENRHAVLGMQYFSFEKYVRNHLVSASENIEFDCISEFWQDTAVALAVMASPAGDIFREDEKKFMDLSKKAPCEAHETLLFGPPRTVDPIPTTKRMILVKAGLGADVQALLEETAAWGRRLGSSGYAADRILLNATRTFPGSPVFPYAGIVSIWPKAGSENISIGTGPASAANVVEVRVESHESPPELLAKMRKSA